MCPSAKDFPTKRGKIVGGEDREQDNGGVKPHFPGLSTRPGHAAYLRLSKRV